MNNQASSSTAIRTPTSPNIRHQCLFERLQHKSEHRPSDGCCQAARTPSIRALTRALRCFRPSSFRCRTPLPSGQNVAKIILNSSQLRMRNSRLKDHTRENNALTCFPRRPQGFPTVYARTSQPIVREQAGTSAF